MGGYLIYYAGEFRTPTEGLSIIKCLFNSVIANLQAKIMLADIVFFNLNTIFTSFEYIQLSLRNLPSEIITQYKLDHTMHTYGFVYVKFQKCM